MSGWDIIAEPVFFWLRFERNGSEDDITFIRPAHFAHETENSHSLPIERKQLGTRLKTTRTYGELIKLLETNLLDALRQRRKFEIWYCLAWSLMSRVQHFCQFLLADSGAPFRGWLRGGMVVIMVLFRKRALDAKNAAKAYHQCCAVSFY